MKQEEIERIIGQLVPAAGSRNMDYWAGVNNAAAEIAKLVRGELEILAKERDEFEAQNLDMRAEYDDELAAKDMQLAETREALEEIHDYIEREVSPAWRDAHMAKVFVMLEEALSAAPEDIDKELRNGTGRD